ncbi:MAG: ketol-acid reductoisomerase [Thermoanaerobaculia bacterium]|nr:ketol-acid reductoisomerase [Thermoanaerobaculia bacterium]
MTTPTPHSPDQPTARLFYEDDADPSHLSGTTVAIIGYGSQGHAHALNLKDSGIDVVVGLRPDSAGWQQAADAGLRVASVAEAAASARLISLLVPDTSQAAVFRDSIAPHLEPGDTLLFAHGFNVRYELLELPTDIDVVMVAPKSPGHRVRELYQQGAGAPALIAVEQDATGCAHATALAYAHGIGATRAGVLETTFAEETETDLFGEQAVLCGGVTGLVRSAFEVLVSAGYQPEVAYFECLHELKLIVDLMYRGGLGEMWHSVSDTAEHGGYEGGARLVDDETRRKMTEMLTDIRDGSYARRWIAEDDRGRPDFERRRAAEQQHPIEQVGARLRQRIAFLDGARPARPVTADV